MSRLGNHFSHRRVLVVDDDTERRLDDAEKNSVNLVNQADMDHHYNPGRVNPRSSKSSRVALLGALALQAFAQPALTAKPNVSQVGEQNYLKLRKKRF